MESKHSKIGLWFMFFGLGAVALALLVGVLASIQFLYPQFITNIPFHKLRPLHVSLAVSWIFLAAVGGIYYYLPEETGSTLFSNPLARIQLFIFLGTGLAVIVSYLMGKFGGREYWEFPPAYAIPIIVSWILFGINYAQTVRKKKGKWPVYLWMWMTGIAFFFFTYLEANAWTIPYFRNNVVRELTVQWKAYGALVGSWNMLVYGTAIFVMTRISGNREMAHSKTAFLLYFLGLTNLMFGWAHHTYIVPSAPWVRHVAYIVSMSELLILGKIIWDWKSSLEAYRKHNHVLAYKFLVASDVWVFVNLVLALIMSVPAFNSFTHGTHITVAHAMGSTIGINTMILLASVFYALSVAGQKVKVYPVVFGYRLLNVFLAVFWSSLVLAGIGKGIRAKALGLNFSEMMEYISPYLHAFAYSGIGVMIGLGAILTVGMMALFKAVRS
jgi:nitric oxide reductase subunit B